MFGSRKILSSLSSAASSAGRLAFGVQRRQYGQQMKAYPQYAVFGEQCMLSIKFLPPVFKYLDRNQTLIVDGAKKGRLLMEWIPRNPDGKLREGDDVALCR